MDVDPDSPPWQRQEAYARELEMLIAILVHRHGINGTYTVSLDELFVTREALSTHPVVIPDFGQDQLTIHVL